MPEHALHPDDRTAPVSAVAPPAQRLTLGAAVTVTACGWPGSTGLHIVLDARGDNVKLVELCGNGDPYWPVPIGWLNEVDRDALLTAVAGLTGPARRPQ